MEKSSRPSSLAEKDPGAWKPPPIPHTPGSVGAYSSPAASVHITEHGVVSTQHIGADLDSMLLSLTACRCPPKIHGAFSKQILKNLHTGEFLLGLNVVFVLAGVARLSCSCWQQSLHKTIPVSFSAPASPSLGTLSLYLPPMSTNICTWGPSLLTSIQSFSGAFPVLLRHGACLFGGICSSRNFPLNIS